MTFAEKLKTLRAKRGLTQMALSEQSGVSYPIIALIESGARNPSKEAAKKLSVFFGVSLDTFITDSDITCANSAKPLDTATILKIARAIQVAVDKNGYNITDDQITQLVDYFYQQNTTEPTAIEKQLSIMQLLNSKSFQKAE